VTERREPPRNRNGQTYEIKVADATVYVSTGEYEDGTLAEVFFTISKRGSTLQGLARWLGITLSLALQHGIPLEHLASVPMSDLDFEPNGRTNDPEIGEVKSLAEAIFVRLLLDYGAE